jgi:hypothetical protein
VINEQSVKEPKKNGKLSDKCEIILYKLEKLLS